MHASSRLHLLKTRARPPAGASRPAARAVTTSGADDANDRTPGSTPADAVGDTTKKSSTVDELGKQMRGRLCAATDAEKQEARVASHGGERRGDAQHVPAAEQSPQQQQAAVRLQRVVRGRAARTAAAATAKAATATTTVMTLDGTMVAAKPASVTSTPSLTKAVRRARRR